MSNENWNEVETIFNKALNLTGEERSLYLAEACSKNSSLFSEVKALINAFEEDSDFIDEPVFEIGLNVLCGKPRKNLANSTIGFYQVLERLGSGGMGEVYAAIDTRLNRKVALKFLSESFGNDNWAKRQLVKEAQAVAMLEHSNICAVHGIEQTDEHNFIVMQYIDGTTLAESIHEEQISNERIVSIARQIITAVAFAHSHGVIHRDLKPGNIMIAGDGQIKVLDFGLAKIIHQKQNLERNAENTSHISRNGLIMGTVSYMSPEQLRGDKLDYRSDVFSVGIILYELITKQNPFQRNTQAETIAAILNSEPPALKRLTPNPPAGFGIIVRKCLQKDTEKRFQSAAEILVELDNLRYKNHNNSVSRRWTAPVFNAFVAVLALIIICSILFFYINQSHKPTLVVLPISTESQANESDYIAAGLTQSVIEKLSNLTSLKVKSESFIANYKGQSVDPKTVGKELKVDVVFTGSITKRADDFILKSKLIRTLDGFILGENEFSLKESELIAVQDDISSWIVGKMQTKLSDEDKNKLARKFTQNPAALKSYFLGRFYWNRRGKDDLKNAIQYFREATNQDPYFAEAWSGLADSYALYSVPGYSGSISSEEAIKMAKAAAKNALQIDNSLSEPYASLGMIKLRYEWDWSGAENYFRTAIERDSESAPAHFGLSNVLVIRGRFDESLQEARKMQEFAPFSASSDLNLARVYYYRRDYEQSANILTNILTKDPNNERVSYALGFQFLQTGKLNEAINIFEKIYKSDNLFGSSGLGYAYAKVGRTNEAKQILFNLEQLSRENPAVPSQEKAFIYLGLGDLDKTFESLNQSCAEHFPALPYLVIDPLFDKIRSDARFAKIRQCVNL